MVSQQTLKASEFNDLEQYYNYILDSEINGQRKQVKELINHLSKRQLKELHHYLNVNFECSDSDIVKEIVFNKM